MKPRQIHHPMVARNRDNLLRQLQNGAYYIKTAPALTRASYDQAVIA